MAGALQKPHRLALVAGEGAFLGALGAAGGGWTSSAVGLSLAGLILFVVALGLWLWRGRG